MGAAIITHVVTPFWPAAPSWGIAVRASDGGMAGTGATGTAPNNTGDCVPSLALSRDCWERAQPARPLDGAVVHLARSWPPE